MKIKHIMSVGLVVASLAITSIAATGCNRNTGGEQQAKKQYTCTHHPEVVQDTPGTCPKCNMALVDKK